jgi:CBS domain-containing protein
MSARAAWRLEQVGFTEVYDYSVGRGDWESAGLPIEGTDVRGPIVAAALTHDVPRVMEGNTVEEARRRLEGGTQVVVVNAENVVVGVMRKESWDRSDDTLVGDAMRLGPATARPGSQLAPLVGRMDSKGVESVIVSDAEGRLIGVISLQSGKAALKGEVESSFEECESCPGWWRFRSATQPAKDD